MHGGLNVTLAILISIVIAFGLVYITVLTGLGIKQTHKDGVTVAGQEALLDAEPDASLHLYDFTFYFLIAGLNEEEVIGGTITSLLRDQHGASVVMINDGSDDRTAAIVESFESTGRVMLLNRELPNARLGKGRALNNGMEIVRADAAERGLDPAKVIVGVMDADGRLTPNATHHVAREFAADPSVGGMQLVVRIRNRDSLPLSFQDMEFWAMSGISQLGRVKLGSVSMGGNGQFTRLSALNEVGLEPWSESLTEDLDLGISLAILGWTMISTPWAYVTQQGVGDFKRLLRQRTRWYQGHMMSIRRLPELANSRYLPTGRFLEMSAYLAVPWVISLPWSLLQQYMIFELITGRGLPQLGGVVSVSGRIVIGLIWYLVSFSPHVFWGVTYWRRSRTVPLWRALMMAHLIIAWSYVAHIAAWRALGRIVLRRNTWAKTAREAEDSIVAPVVVTAPSLQLVHSATATSAYVGRRRAPETGTTTTRSTGYVGRRRAPEQLLAAVSP